METKHPQVPSEMREFAEKSVDQARKAFDGFMAAAKKSVTTFEGSATNVRTTATDVTQKAFGYAEQNVAAAFELAQKLVRAKDLQEAMQLQTEYAQTQFAAMQAQMKELGAMTQRAMNQAGANAQAAAKEAAETAQAAVRKAGEAAAETGGRAKK